MRYNYLPDDDVKLNHIIALLIASSLFVVGRFGFFDILGVKRFLEVFLFLPLILIGSLTVFKYPLRLFSPLLFLPISFLWVEIFINGDLLSIADNLASILVVGILLTVGPACIDLVLRYTIKFSAFFATLGLIQFVILLIDPSRVQQILLFYDHYSGSNVPVIENFFQLLGLADGTSYHLWGMSVTRLRSFTSEPSLLVGYFLIPGALALTYEKKYRTFGLICIAFSICSLAGSVFTTLMFTLLVMALLCLRSSTIFIFFPFVLLLIFFWILNYHYHELIALTKSSAGSYDFLDKTNSANMRFGYIRDFIPKVMTSPFGLNEEIHQPLGLLIGAMARGGLLGLIFISIILFNLYCYLGKILVEKNMALLNKLGFAIVYGALITGILFLDNCFIQLYGFTLLVLIYYRALVFSKN